MTVAEVTAEGVIEILEAKGYTARQVVNSLARSLAHQKENGSDEIAAVYQVAYNQATASLSKAHHEEFIPCDPRCMGAVEDQCECFCAGANHGRDHAIESLTDGEVA